MIITKKVVCQKCKAIFKFDPNKIKSEVVKFKCPHCTSIQYIRKPSPPKETVSSPVISKLKPETERGFAGENQAEEPKEVAQETQPQTTEERAQAAEPQIPEELAQEAQLQMPEEVAQKAESRITEETGKEFSGVHKTIAAENEGAQLAAGILASKVVVCQKCNAKFKFDPDKITSEVVKFKCPRCSLVQQIRRPDSPEGLSSIPPTSEPDAKAEIILKDSGAIPSDQNIKVAAEKTFAGDIQTGMPEEVKKEAPVAHKPPAKKDEAGAGDTEMSRFANKESLHLADGKNDEEELQSSPADPDETLINLLQAQAHNLQGETLISKNLFNQAIQDFSRALEIRPHHVDALINRGSAYAILGMLDDALADYTHALKFESKDFEIYNKRGEIYLQNTMYDEAIKDFTSALILNPMFGSGYLNRGRAYSEKGLHDEAMTDYNQAVRTDFEHASFSFSAQASPVMYIDEEKTGDEEESTKFKQQGLADLKNERYEEAVENFTQAIHHSANDAEGYLFRGVTFLKLLQPDKAMTDFNQAALFDPLNASLYFWRAKAWKEKDDPFNMIEDLKRSCELGYEPACTEYSKHKLPKK